MMSYTAYPHHDRASRVTLINTMKEVTEDDLTGQVSSNRNKVCILTGQMPDWPPTDVVVSLVGGDSIVSGKVIRTQVKDKGRHGEYAELSIDTNR